MSITITYNEGDGLLEQCGLGVKIITGSLAFTGTYTATGEDLDLSKIFPNSIDFIRFEGNGGYVFEYSRSLKKVKAFYPTSTHKHEIKIKDLDGADGVGVPVFIDEDAGNANERLMAVAPGNNDMTHESEELAAVVGEEVETGKNLTALTAVKFFAIGR